MDIFNLKIKQYFCPLCGKWHDLADSYQLNDYTRENPLHLNCPKCENSIYYLYRKENLLHAIFFPCTKKLNNIVHHRCKGNFYIPENNDIDLLFLSSLAINKYAYLPNRCHSCKKCDCFAHCNLIASSQRVSYNKIEISIGFIFETAK